jgi:hypothetical protein
MVRRTVIAIVAVIKDLMLQVCAATTGTFRPARQNQIAEIQPHQNFISAGIARENSIP